MPGYIMMCLLKWVVGFCAELGSRCKLVKRLCGCLGNHSPLNLLDCMGDGLMDDSLLIEEFCTHRPPLRECVVCAHSISRLH